MSEPPVEPELSASQWIAVALTDRGYPSRAVPPTAPGEVVPSHGQVWVYYPPAEPDQTKPKPEGEPDNSNDPGVGYGEFLLAISEPTIPVPMWTWFADGTPYRMSREYPPDQIAAAVVASVEHNVDVSHLQRIRTVTG